MSICECFSSSGLGDSRGWGGGWVGVGGGGDIRCQYLRKAGPGARCVHKHPLS